MCTHRCCGRWDPVVSVWPTLAQQNGRSGAARTACRPTETCCQSGYLRATAVTRGNRVVRHRAARNGHAWADSAVRRHPEHTGDRKSLESFPGGPITSNPGRAVGTPRTALGTPQSARWTLIRWCPSEPLEPCSVAAILGKGRREGVPQWPLRIWKYPTASWKGSEISIRPGTYGCLLPCGGGRPGKVKSHRSVIETPDGRWRSMPTPPKSSTGS